LPSPATSPQERQARHFFVAWSMATLFHQASFMRLASDPLEALLTLTAVAVLVAPRRSAPFVVLLCAQVVEIALRAPQVSNHWWMSGAISLTLLMTLIPALREGFSPGRWLSHFRGPLRAILIVVYFYGVFHKINADFLDPEISCGVDLYRTLARSYLPFLPDSAAAAWFSIFGTLAVETAIPLLLLWPNTRAWGVTLGVGFHFFLGFVPYSVYYNFSSALFALFLLFIPPGAIENREEIGAGGGITSDRTRWIGLALLVAFMSFAAWHSPTHRGLWRHLHRIPWAVYGGGIVLLTIRAFARRNEADLTPATEHAHRVRRWPFVMPVLFFLNGASPYLGLKTETSLAMYSNLRTEGGSSNHLLIAQTLDPFDRTTQIVTIEQSSNRELRRLAKRRRALLWFEFRDYLARHPKTRASWALNGVPSEVARARDDERFSSPEPWWIRKFVYFRPVDLDLRKRCSH
jgi:hypothetical protein